MFTESIKNDLQTFAITAKDNITQATFVSGKGGVCASIIMPTKKGKREILFAYDHLWNKESKDFPGAWPLCFPVCARIGLNGKENYYQYKNQTYKMHIHGFGYQMPWEVMETKDNQITMKLSYTNETLQQYPFKFEAKLIYTIEPGKLICKFICINHGKELMPYSFGFHPYFLTPPVKKGKDDVTLDYRPIKHYVYNKAMTDVEAEKPLFKLPTSITDPSIREQLTLLGDDKKVRLHFRNDTLEMTGDKNFPYIQIYHEWDLPFICIEPWMAYPNAINHIKAPVLDNMPGMHLLNPGERECSELSLVFVQK